MLSFVLRLSGADIAIYNVLQPSQTRNGAITSGGTRSGRPLALSRIAQVVFARTRTLPSRADELDMAVEPRALGRLADPGASGHRLAGADAAQIVDLVPDHDPDIGVDMRRIGDRRPMRGRHVLDPAHPGRIVDVAELVNVLGAERSTGRSNDRHSAPPICVSTKA